MALLFPMLQFLDPAYTQYARPLSLGYVYTYQNGTTTPKASYTDSTEVTQHSNPIILNSNGQPEVSGSPKGIWLSSDGLYTIVIKNAAGTTIQTINDVVGLGSTLTFFSTLSANLDTNSYSLVTTSGNKDIPITPNGTGLVKVTNLQPQSNVDMNGFNIGMDTGTAITDDSGNEYLKFAKTASAVNELTLTNQATGANPQLSATGNDTNIGIDFLPKGTGEFSLKATSSQAARLRFYEDSDNGTNYATIKPPESLANNNGTLILPAYSLTLPAADGSANGIMVTDGGGTASWTNNITVTSITAGSTIAASGKITANAHLDVKNGSTSSGQIAIYEDSDNGSNKVTMTVPSALSADYTLTLPAAVPSGSHGIPESDTSGTLSFVPQGHRFVSKVSSSGATVTLTFTPLTSGANFYKVYFRVQPAADNVDLFITCKDTGGTSAVPSTPRLLYSTTGTTFVENTTAHKIAVGCGNNNTGTTNESCSGEMVVQGNRNFGTVFWTDTSSFMYHGTFSCSSLNLSLSVGSIVFSASSGNVSVIAEVYEMCNT